MINIFTMLNNFVAKITINNVFIIKVVKMGIPFFKNKGFSKYPMLRHKLGISLLKRLLKLFNILDHMGP